MARVPLYDNLPATPLLDDPSMVEVERIYCLDFDRFEPFHWTDLDAIYRALPGAYRVSQTPMWFGGHDERPPFLWASVEPPGVQVYGVLPLSAWVEWDAAFVALLDASTLPFRDLD